MLLVMAISSAWSSKASLTASVVVPILMNREDSFGMSAAAALPIAVFSSAAILPPVFIFEIGNAGGQFRAAMDARQQSLLAQGH